MRLDERYRIEHERVHALEDEIERLRAEVEMYRNKPVGLTEAELEAEVERLRAENESLLSDYDTNAVTILRAEVERLREQDDHTPETEVQRLRDEVERLRASRNAAVDELLVQGQEVERLRKKGDWGDRQVEVVQELEAEVGRLRAQLQDKQAMYEGQTAEVESLRKEVERQSIGIRELNRQLDNQDELQAEAQRLRAVLEETDHYLGVAQEELKDPAWDLYTFSVVATMVRKARAALAKEEA